ncbi:MAG: polysaccharide deacetylase family protein [Pedosphaera sp.]|nr:polysaccharide deacetylase family protein [Pedosphaera sp.]
MSVILAICALLLSPVIVFSASREPVPDKLVVLTFDDSVSSHHSVVRPILKRLGFGATFFITEGFSFRTNKQDYMTWEQIAELHRDGFEIGNHTRDHLSVTRETLGRLREQVEAINARCAEHGIPRPVSFGYPGNAIVPEAIPILRELGFKFARRGGAPEHAYEWGRGFAFTPGEDHPLLIPSAGDARPDWTLADFKRAADQARGGRIAVLQFHGVPDRDHPWVHSDPKRFAEYMDYLGTNHFQVVALRDLARFVDPERAPADPQAVIERRKRESKEVVVECEVRDATTNERLAARIYIRGTDGAWHFPKSSSLTAPAVRYERRNGSNTNAIEMHTTVAAQSFWAELSPGRYTFTVERGKEYFPETREVDVAAGMPKITFAMRRWVNMAEMGWYSGDAHNHRDPAGLPSAMLAEDVNVALPMIDWTTVTTVSPAASPRSFAGKFTDQPVKLDSTHVWFARNSEYEIFTTGTNNHTLGAFLILNHHSRIDKPVFPLRVVAEQARAEGALIDLEKHNWPWSLTIVPLIKPDLFELANNHHWRVEYAVRNWAEPAPSWMGIAGTGTDTELGWTHYGFQTYYALLNCGFRIRPTAGTANGVHPVPLGFSRVYVQLDEPFSYEAWMRGLSAGRSFVTTGPMMFGQVDGRNPGHVFNESDSTGAHSLKCRVLNEQPLDSIELIVNGIVAERFTPENRRNKEGAFESEVTSRFPPKESSWLAWRCFEQRPQGRFRFAHTAPWHFEVAGQPIRPRRVEIDWLVSSVEKEIARSRALIPSEGLEEYNTALGVYRDIARRAR